ncbi:hypothetical protein SZ55_3397 [Pseudomonas sp. FeS53a]|nr:hypothetical protein SZ55_3397 [Pseudomonas sp. FeS53a]
MCHAGRQSRSCRNCQYQFANPNHSVIPCFIFSSRSNERVIDRRHNARFALPRQRSTRSVLSS